MVPNELGDGGSDCLHISHLIETELTSGTEITDHQVQ